MSEARMLPSSTATVPDARFGIGTRVIIRNQYIGSWAGGFVVAGVVDDGYILGRLSDHRLLPDVFPFSDVRLERRRDPFRGIRGSYLDRR